jgi:hypothetical protein
VVMTVGCSAVLLEWFDGRSLSRVKVSVSVECCSKDHTARGRRFKT